MDRFVNQFSEIGKLNAVMLHRPGDELNQVTPDFFDDMLIDDTLYLPAAQRDHARFAEILGENGAAGFTLGSAVILDQMPNIIFTRLTPM